MLDKKSFAPLSVILGILFIIPIAPMIGLVLGIISYKEKINEKLSLVGIVICSIGTLSYILTAIILVMKYLGLV